MLRLRRLPDWSQYGLYSGVVVEADWVDYVVASEPDLQFAGEHDEKSFQEVSVRAWDLLFKVSRVVKLGCLYREADIKLL